MTKSVSLALALALAACSSAPAPERSAHPDSTEDSSARESPASDPPAPPLADGPSADPVAEAPAASLAALQTRLGCHADAPATVGSVRLFCGALAKFVDGRTPDLRAGNLPGVVIEPGPEGRDLAGPALLAVRAAGPGAEVAWGRVLPHDPRQAADLSEMAADVLAGRAPTLAPSPWPGLVWNRVQPTDGKSLQIAAGPRVLVRQSDDLAVVLVLDAEAPLVALHRASAR